MEAKEHPVSYVARLKNLQKALKELDPPVEKTDGDHVAWGNFNYGGDPAKVDYSGGVSEYLEAGQVLVILKKVFTFWEANIGSLKYL